MEDYVYRPLPDLGSGSRDVQHRKLASAHTLERSLPRDALRSAFAALLTRYMSAPDFLFAELAAVEGRVSYVPFRGSEPPASAVDLPTARRLLALADSPKHHPFPAAFFWGPPDAVDSEWAPGCVILAAHSALTLLHDAFLLSPASAYILLSQIISLARASGSFDALPQPLLSAHTSPFPAASSSADTPSVAPQWLIHNARTRPDAVAHEIYHTLVPPGEHQPAPQLVTYGELNRASNRLARWLLDRIHEGQPVVALCRPRDALFYIAHAAIWKAGACYVSIDAELPETRRAFIASDSRARCVLTTPDLVAAFPSSLALPAERALAQSASFSSSDICLAALDDLAYILYTSGTTGAPKGCLLAHRGLFFAIDAMCAYPRPVTDPDNDKRLAMASTAFDVHLSEIAQSWLLGTRLLSAPHSRFALLADLQAHLVRFGVTHLGMVPSMIDATLTKTPRELPLKYLVSGGEKISDNLLKKWADLPDLILANFYGPTETTIGCTSRVVSRHDRKENIGRAFPGTAAYVVDPASIHIPDSSEELPTMRLAPRGAPGELLIAGPLVGRGYLHLPAATHQAFLEWPRKGSRAYRTGDLVRMMPDGSLEILGRIDGQIKLRGVRIEAEGVSAVLQGACPDEDECRVDAATLVSKHPELSGGQADVLVSFVARSPSAVPPAARRTTTPSLSPLPKDQMRRLQEAVGRELAVYMRPSYIVPVDFLPLSFNGKTDTRVLAEVFRATPVPRLLQLSSSSAPAQEAGKREPTETEGEIIKAVCELARLDPAALSPASNLFECGLDSLGFAALARRLRVPVRALMGAPTVEGAAAAAAASSTSTSIGRANPSAAPADPTQPSTQGSRSGSHSDHHTGFSRAFAAQHRALAASYFPPAHVESVLPPFPVQEGVLFRAQDSDSGRYVQHFVYLLKEGTDVRRVRAGWEDVKDRVEILRTVFVSDRVCLQVVLRPEAATVPFTTHTLSEDIEFREWFWSSEASRIAKDINADFTTPLYRVNVYSSTSKKDMFMVISINHALYDGNAMPLLVDAFEAAYHRQASPEPVVSLADVLDAIPRPSEDELRTFWSARFEGVDLQSRARAVRPPGPDSRVTQRSRVFDVSLGDVQDVAARLHVHMQSLLSVAFAFAGRELFGWTGDAIFGTVRTGRTLPVERISEAICPLVCVVPARVNLSKGSFDELAKAAQADVNANLSMEPIALGPIQRVLGVKDLVNVVFSCRNATAPRRSDVIEFMASPAPEPEFLFALEMVFDEQRDTMEAKMAFADVEDAAVSELLKGLEMILQGLVRGDLSLPGVTSGELSPTSSRATGPQTSSNSGDHPVDPKLEASLTEQIAQFLGIDTSVVQPTTSLLSLGINSLSAARLSTELTQCGSGVKYTAIDVIEADSVRRLAQRKGEASSSVQSDVARHEQAVEELSRQLDEEIRAAHPELSEDDRVEVVGCSSLQAGMLSQTLNSEGKLYVHAFPFRLNADCDVARLRVAWQRTVSDIAILRTSFHFSVTQGRWAQVVHSDADFKWSEEDIADGLHETSGVWGATRRFLRTLSFKNETDFVRPPLHLRLLKGSDSVRVLVVVMHHALYDGLSLPKLFRYVRRSYFDTVAASSPTQFHSLMKNILLEERQGLDFWRSRLSGMTPYIFPRQSAQTRAWRATFDVSVATDDIQRACRRYGVGLQCIGQAAWAKALAKRCQIRDVIFGQVVSGRVVAGVSDVENVIGPVFNTITCRATLSRGQTNKELLRAMQKFNVEGLPWQHLSLRDLQRSLGFSAGLFDSLFLFQVQEPAATGDDPKSIWELVENSETGEGTANGSSQYAFNIEIHQVERGFVLHTSSSAAVIDYKGFLSVLSDTNEAIQDLVHSPNGPSCDSAIPDIETRSASSRTISSASLSSLDDLSAPQTQLLEILEHFTGLPSPVVRNADTTLTSLGIDSISAVQVAGLLRKDGVRMESGQAIGAADVARCKTIADILQLSASSGRRSTSSAPVRCKPAPSSVLQQVYQTIPRDCLESVKPVSPGMEWYIGGWQERYGLWHRHVFAFTLGKRLDADSERRFQDAWKALVVRHAILRSGVVHLNDNTSEKEPVWRFALCVYKEGQDVAVENVPPESCPTHEAESQYLRSRAAELRVPEATLHEPLTRVLLLHAQTETYFVIGLHHVQYDAFSLRSLIRDLERLVTGGEATSNGDMDLLLHQFHDVDDSAGISFWREALSAKSGWTPGLFSSSNPATPRPEKRSQRSRKVLPKVLRWFLPSTQPVSVRQQTGLIPRHRTRASCNHGSFTSLTSLARDWNIGIGAIVLACWSQVHSRSGKGHYRSSAGDVDTTGKATFVIVHSGRTRHELDNVAVPTVNMLPVHVEWTSPTTDLTQKLALLIDNQLKSVVDRNMEQSRLGDVWKWCGKRSGRFSDVFINIVPDAGREGQDVSKRVLLPVKLDYELVGTRKVAREELWVPEFSADVSVDVLLNSREDTVSISIECDGDLMIPTLLDEVGQDCIDLLSKTAKV